MVASSSQRNLRVLYNCRKVNLLELDSTIVTIVINGALYHNKVKQFNFAYFLWLLSRQLINEISVYILLSRELTYLFNAVSLTMIIVADFTVFVFDVYLQLCSYSNAMWTKTFQQCSLVHSEQIYKQFYIFQPILCQIKHILVDNVRTYVQRFKRPDSRRVKHWVSN